MPEDEFDECVGHVWSDPMASPNTWTTCDSHKLTLIWVRFMLKGTDAVPASLTSHAEG